MGKEGEGRGVGDCEREGKYVGAGCDVDDTVESMEVGRKFVVVQVGGEEEFGDSLDRVGWVFCEIGFESSSY